MVSARIKRIKHKDLPSSIKGPRNVKVGLVAGIADNDAINHGIWNEFGTSRGIPERPFLRNAMRANKKKYHDEMREAAKSLVNGTTTLDVFMSKLGILAENDIKNEITSLASPPNAPSTVRQKGSSNPLIDTGEMRDNVRYKVEP